MTEFREVRQIQITTRSRAGAAALAAGTVAVGATLVVLGATMLVGLAAVGTAAGVGGLVLRRVTGRSPRATPRPGHGLDPRLEVTAPARRRLPPPTP